jgi:GDPmannose 4,6-dehydratase
VRRQGQKTALVTGVTGQDGSFLAELLLEQGYAVSGMVRREPDAPLGAAEHLRGRVELIYGDLLEPRTLEAAVADRRPSELYHLAAPSFVPESWARPAQTLLAIAGASAALLEAVCAHSADTRVFLAISAAIFAGASESPQDEDTVCRPNTPYAIAKLAAHQLAVRLRQHEGLYACSGILYNHESERRPESFVSRKITRAAAAIKLGMAEEVVLGDLAAVRDWSFAADIMRGAWLMLQQEDPRDYILASGVPHTVAELAEIAFSHVGLHAEDHVRVDPKLLRSMEEVPLVGDPSRARNRLGWRPTLGFEALIRRMVNADLRELGGSTGE